MTTESHVTWTPAAAIHILGIAPNGDTIVAGVGQLELARSADGAFCLGTRPQGGYGNSGMGLGFKIDRDSMIALMEIFAREIDQDMQAAGTQPLGEGIAPPLPAELCSKCDQVHVPGNGSPLLGC